MPKFKRKWNLLRIQSRVTWTLRSKRQALRYVALRNDITTVESTSDHPIPVLHAVYDPGFAAGASQDESPAQSEASPLEKNTAYTKHTVQQQQQQQQHNQPTNQQERLNGARKAADHWRSTQPILSPPLNCASPSTSRLTQFFKRHSYRKTPKKPTTTRTTALHIGICFEKEQIPELT